MFHKSLYPLFFVLLWVAGCQETDVAPTAPTDLVPNEHLLLGNPSNATPDEANANNYLLQKPQYTMSYSRERGTPNWTSWHVSQDWLGTAYSYSGSGFDRGHHVPSADRTRSVEDNSATFLMTNMIPQAPQHNQQTWANLEDYARDLVAAGQEVYVMMGSYGTGGTGSSGPKQTIADGQVTVPAQIWKVLVILPEGQDDLSRINSNTRVIAANTPNSQTVRADWGSYRTSVDALEKATGYDLLNSLSNPLQAALEAPIDKGPTQ